LPTLPANGIDIAYDVHGAGPPLVLLHGATSLGAEDFAAQVPLFSKAFRCYLPEARGHGRTRWDVANGFRYDWLVDDLVAFVDGLGLDTFHLVGFSMGAMTALMFATRQPERLRTLAVVGITTEREPRASVARRLMDPVRADRDDPAWAALLGRRHDAGQGPGAWRRLLPAIAADVAVQPLLSPRDLRRIDPPTLVVCGDRDPFVPVEHASGIRRQLPDGRLFVAPDCGHEVMSRKPSLFNEALAGFYRSTAATAERRTEAWLRDRGAAVRPSATTRAGHEVGEANPLAGGPPADAASDQDWLSVPAIDPRRRPDDEVRDAMTTLLALYRRPDGDEDALATFLRRYHAEHLPLVAQTPGLRATRVQRVNEALGGQTDLVLITAMDFDDRAALDAGLASDAMRQAGRNLREIAPGLATLLVLEDEVPGGSAGG
jgi:uncharacterized protein (TIGR02118 family)